MNNASKDFALFEFNPMETIAVDLKGKITAVNLAKRMSGDRLPNIGDLMYQDYAAKHTIDMHAELMTCISSGITKRFPELKYGEKILSITISPFPEGALIISEDITKQVLSLQNLIESEEWHRVILQTAMDGVWLFDNQGYFLEVNDAYCQMSGYSRAELSSMTIAAVEATEKSEDIEMHIRKIIEKGDDRFETRHRRKNGTTFDVEVSTQFRPAKGGVFIAFLRDISERKISEEKERQQSNKFKELTENVPGLVFQFKRMPDGIYCVPIASRGITEIFGCSAQDVRENFTSISNAIVPEDSVRVINAIEYSASTLTNFFCEFRVQIPGKSIQWIESNLKPVKSNDGSITWNGFCHDITVRKHIEQELEKRSQLNRTLLNSLPHPAMLIRGSDKIVLAANTIASELGVAVGKHCWRKFSKMTCLSPGDKERASKYPDIVPTELGICCTFCQGNECLVENPVQNNPEVSAFGKLWDTYWMKIGKDMFLHYVIDVTERKRMEVTAIESERLSAIGEMAAGVAHDFNNALQVISGNLALAVRTPGTPPRAIEFIEAAQKSTTDAASRIRQLLRFTKKSSVSIRVPIDLNALLNDAFVKTRPLWKDEAEKSGIQVVFRRLLGEIGTVEGDPGEIGSVLHNLLKNSIEAMPDGGVITLKTIAHDDKILVEISDTGVGMSVETRKRIFQPFFSTKGLEQGRGLGMSAAHAIIRDHGGTITVIKTAPGKGTTIELSFPSGSVEKQEPVKEILNVNRVSARVLWVDDDKSIRELGRMILEELGHFANIADSGKRALELLEFNAYDLLITDVGMPEMSGWQLADIVKIKYPDVRIAVVTGWGADVSKEKKSMHGVGYVLGKPISSEELNSLVQEAVQLKN